MVFYILYLKWLEARQSSLVLAGHIDSLVEPWAKYNSTLVSAQLQETFEERFY